MLLLFFSSPFAFHGFGFVCCPSLCGSLVVCVCVCVCVHAQKRQSDSAKAHRRLLKKQVKQALEEVSKLRTDTKLLANHLATEN